MEGGIKRHWSLRTPDEEVVRDLSRRTGFSDTSSRILANRGLSGSGEAERFLAAGLSDLSNPLLMADLERGAGRLADAILSGEPLLIYADYDVDGATGAACLHLFLKDVRSGLPVRIHQNHRIFDGYGLKPAHIALAARDGFRLVVTVDCGISDLSAIRGAAEMGVEVIVTDHHLPGPELPPAFAVINPRRDDCGFPGKDLAGVGVVFMLICGIRKALRERGAFEGREEPNLRRYLDLVALGTVADMVPLRGDNRILVRAGIDEIRSRPRPGIAALMAVAKLAPRNVTESDLGFRIAPRLNAAGRLGDSGRSSRLLLAADPAEAAALAAELDEENGRRQREEERILREAETLLAAASRSPADEGAIVLADAGWHLGVLGIVASKIAERHCVPTVLLAVDGGEAVGSCRSVEGFSIVDALGELSGILTRSGGHSQAAGVSLPVSKLAEFREGLGRIALESASDGTGRVPRIDIDAEVCLADVTEGLLEEWERLRPFGIGNREPVLRAGNLRLTRVRPFGADRRHVALEVEGDGRRFEVSAFNRPDAGRVAGSLEMLFTPQWSHYRGTRSVRLLLRDLRPSPGAGRG